VKGLAVKTVQAKMRQSSGGEAGTIDLSADVFGAPVYTHLVHQVVRWQRAKKRAGTHDVLSRSEMKGGGKKPWKQKGTGRARAGSIISPLWVGGAVVHGPSPRSYEFKVPKGIRRKALSSALTSKMKSSNVVVVDQISSTDGKTKGMAAMLKNLGVSGSTLVVLSDKTFADKASEQTVKALRNISRITLMPVAGINVYDIMKAKYVVIASDALKGIESRCLGNAE
jgi:large subunit ribosomal protein L4